MLVSFNDANYGDRTTVWIRSTSCIRVIEDASGEPRASQVVAGWSIDYARMYVSNGY